MYQMLATTILEHRLKVGELVLCEFFFIYDEWGGYTCALCTGSGSVPHNIKK